MNLLSLFIVFCAAALFALLVFWTEPLCFLPALERLTPNIVYRVRTRLPLVALSFDDGPHPIFTPQVLDILQHHDAKATFFLIGDRALCHPNLVAAIRAAGHEIGNHYSSDVPTLAHSEAKFLHNLDQTEATLGLDRKPAVFRPPGGLAWRRQIQFARQRGYTCVLGCAYPHDPMHPPVWYIRWLVEKNLVPGSIVILHDGISDPSRSLQPSRTSSKPPAAKASASSPSPNSSETPTLKPANSHTHSGPGI